MRVTNASASRKRRIRTIKAAKGFRGRRSKLYRYAADATDHAKQYSFRDRKMKKRSFRTLWQVRINAAARSAGTTYSRFMEGLKAAKVPWTAKGWRTSPRTATRPLASRSRGPKTRRKQKPPRL